MPACRFMRILCLIVFVTVMAFAGACRAEEAEDGPEQLAVNARTAFAGMITDRQYPGLAALAAKAKAIIIVPDLLRDAFFFGGRGGNAVMLTRGSDGTWSNPAFYTLGGVSWGLQFGGQTSSLVVTVMTTKALRTLVDRPATLGAATGLTIGALGQNVSAAPGMDLRSDLYAFARAGNRFIGVSLEGAVFAPRETWDQDLYGEQATPMTILLDRAATTQTPAAGDLTAVMP